MPDPPAGPVELPAPPPPPVFTVPATPSAGPLPAPPPPAPPEAVPFMNPVAPPPPEKYLTPGEGPVVPLDPARVGDTKEPSPPTPAGPPLPGLKLDGGGLNPCCEAPPPPPPAVH